MFNISVQENDENNFQKRESKEDIRKKKCAFFLNATFGKTVGKET